MAEGGSDAKRYLLHASLGLSGSLYHTLLAQPGERVLEGLDG